MTWQLASPRASDSREISEQESYCLILEFSLGSQVSSFPWYLLVYAGQPHLRWEDMTPECEYQEEGAQLGGGFGGSAFWSLAATVCESVSGLFLITDLY